MAAGPAPNNNDRGLWGSKLGFILAAAGSAVGLGNIWRFPNEVASGGGAAFLLVYLACCFIIGFPVMVAELSIGRRTQRNVVGAFKQLSPKPIWALVGAWGVLCGVMILSFYLVIAGWTLSFVFSELFYGLGNESLGLWFTDAGNPLRNVIFAVVFLVLTIWIVSGGVSAGIERAAKILMPVLIVILAVLIVYVLTQEGASEGLAVYLKPDFSKLDIDLVLSAMGQSFFSLSLGMGALITYGSYLNKNQNIPEAAAYVTLADVGIAFIAGLLILPAMFVANAQGVQIYDDAGSLMVSTGLVFDVLPELFHTMGGASGLILGVTFFMLLSVAALTSTISLLEVPTSYMVDERGIPRKKAAWIMGSLIGLIAIIIAFYLDLIGTIDLVFSTIGLPLGGFLICIFLGWVWKTERALDELEQGWPGVRGSLFGALWPFFIRWICPILIGIVFVVTVVGLF